jgi:hypothetical protein
MTAGLRICEIKLPVIGGLAVWRDFGEQLFPFRLECGGDIWSMTIHDAVRLGRCADTVVRRFEGAARRGDSVNVGRVFSRKDTAGEVIIEFGIDDDVTTYLQLFDLPRVTLQGAQAEQLLAALRRVGDDASSIRGAGNSLGLAQ